MIGFMIDCCVRWGYIVINCIVFIVVVWINKLCFSSNFRDVCLEVFIVSLFKVWYLKILGRRICFDFIVIFGCGVNFWDFVVR